MVCIKCHSHRGVLEGCPYCKDIEIQELRGKLINLENEINTFLTFGQGGASFKESQLLNKMYGIEALIFDLAMYREDFNNCTGRGQRVIDKIISLLSPENEV